MIEKYVFHFLLVIIFGAFVAFTIFILKPFLHTINGNLLGLTNVVVLFWTGVVLVVYTYETLLLRNVAQNQVAETQKQTEIQQRHFVVLDVRYENFEYNIGVKNIGNGSAINIRIKSENSDVYNFSKSVPMLHAGERTNVFYDSPCEEILDEELRPTEFRIVDIPPHDLYPPNAKNTSIIIIEFENIGGQLYFVRETIAPNRIDIDFDKKSQ